MRTPLRLAAAASALTLITGCGPFGDDNDDGEAAGSAEEVEHADGPLVVEGAFGGDNGFPARVSFEHVERWDDRSVLRFTVEPLGDDAHDEGDRMIKSGTFAHYDSGTWDFALIDTVGSTHYKPLADSDGYNPGSPMPQTWFVGGQFEMEAHFPLVPDDVERLTLHAAGDIPPVSGVPVVDGEPPEDPPTGEEDDAFEMEAGDTLALETRGTDVEGEPEDYVDELHPIVEHPSRTRADGGDEATVGLHADVLFELDESELTDEAADTLTEVAEQTRAEADPSQPPINVVGHTDGQGSDDHNQNLSEERANAVHEFLSEELGDDYEYETEGRAADEPVADESADDEEQREDAQATNRRVEISYTLLPEAEREAGADDGDGGGGPLESVVAEPAPFREELGEPVDSGEAQMLEGSPSEVRLDVYPFYRDGAYLVGVFGLETPEDGSAPLDRLEGTYTGGHLTAFGVRGPDEGEVLRTARVGAVPSGETNGDYLAHRQHSIFMEEGESRVGFAYFPAPPEEVDEVTLDADRFGEFTVPVE
ncbi:OmpA family protein [Nocardiopsis sp. HNM0947]|uniref:OmpA family protein n=1 Tax=Nocardiopsis coralli TaxID=2772213 RepID=A0ABR9P780_9ACTN|nr:OmpA family protein [Nocardiopsis coralli]MBE2999698.1 OmpA family protein [Nocardiopsis coralli]